MNATRRIALTLATIVALAAAQAPAPKGEASKPAQDSGKTPPATSKKAEAAAKAAADAPGSWVASPYAIKAWVRFGPSARVAPDQRARWLAEFRRLTRLERGASWRLEVAADDGPLQSESLEAIQAEGLTPLASGLDKIWLLEVARRDGALEVRGREYDALTRRLGPIHRVPARFTLDLGRSLLQAADRVFAPLVELDKPGANTVTVRVRGGDLASGSMKLLAPGDVLTPVRMTLAPDGSVRSVRDIPFTYLRVDDVQGGMATCSIVSALRSPFPPVAGAPVRLVAQGLRPTDRPTRFRFVTGPKREPIPGCIVTMRPFGGTEAREVGWTDRDGSVVLPAGLSDRLMLVRLLAGGVEPLRELPVLPGEVAEEREVPVEARPETVAFEMSLQALQDDLLDLIARRARLEALLGARVEGGAWDEVEKLLSDYRALPARTLFEERLAKLEEGARREQAETKRAVLTRTAQSMLDETRGLINSYLTEDAYKAYQEAFQRKDADAAKAAPAQAAGTPKSAPQPAASPPPAAPTESAPAKSER